MFNSFFRLLFVVGVLTACSSARVPPVAVDWTALAVKRLPSLTPCSLPNIEESVLCGVVEVPEDRSQPGGRRLALDVVVVPAQRETPAADPVFVFEGGPGGAVTKRAPSMLYAGPVRARDIVLVDQRGTAGSHRITCPLGGGQPSLGVLAEMFPADAVRQCAAELSLRADLQRYTTVDFADDIEAVRQHLGYGPINIRGGSYGTRAMMVFAQRYPRSTRSLFGIGVVSPVRSNLAERGVWSDQVLAGLGTLCAADEACSDIMPDLGASMATLLGSLSEGPRTVRLPDPNQLDTEITLDVNRDWLAEKLRLLLYFTFTSRALPWAAHRAEMADDWVPLLQLAVVVQRMFQSSLAYGVLLTIQCGESMDFDVAAALVRGADTLIGTYRLEQQVQGCANWPHHRIPSLGLPSPQVLDTPTLFLSGALDPVTPPAFAEEAATYFPESHHLVLPEGQHGPFDLENAWVCIHEIWAAFLDRGTVEGLDVGCAAEMHRPSFVVDDPAFARYLVEELAPMAG